MKRIFYILLTVLMGGAMFFGFPGESKAGIILTVIPPDGLEDAELGAPYESLVLADCSPDSCTCKESSQVFDEAGCIPSFPPGLHVDSERCVITGTPTGPAGRYKFGVDYDNSNPALGDLAAVSYYLNVNSPEEPAPPEGICAMEFTRDGVSKTANDWCTGGWFGNCDQEKYIFCRGNTSYIFSCKNRMVNHPDLYSAYCNCYLPTATENSDDYTHCPQINPSCSPPPGKKGEHYSYQFTATRSSSFFNWFQGDKKLSDNLGLSLSSSGLLHGTPQSAGDYSFDICVQYDENGLLGGKDCKRFSLNIASEELLQASPSSLAEGREGDDYSQDIYVSGGKAPYNFITIEKPNWLELTGIGINRSKIEIRGTPSLPGTYSLKINISDSSSPIQNIQKNFSIKINQRPAPLENGNGNGDGNGNGNGTGNGDGNGTWNGTGTNGSLASKKGLSQFVPCGGPGDPCKLCDFFVMLDRILDFILFQFVPPVAVLLLVFGGVKFFLAAENPAEAAAATKLMTSVAIGLVIIYGAWLLLNLFFTIIGVADWTGLRQGWFTFPCE